MESPTLAATSVIRTGAVSVRVHLDDLESRGAQNLGAGAHGLDELAEMTVFPSDVMNMHVVDEMDLAAQQDTSGLSVEACEVSLDCVDPTGSLSEKPDVKEGLEKAVFVRFSHSRKVYRETLHCFSFFAKKSGWCFDVPQMLVSEDFEHVILPLDAKGEDASRQGLDNLFGLSSAERRVHSFHSRLFPSVRSQESPKAMVLSLHASTYDMERGVTIAESALFLSRDREMYVEAPEIMTPSSKETLWSLMNVARNVGCEKVYVCVRRDFSYFHELLRTFEHLDFEVVERQDPMINSRSGYAVLVNSP
ncbi:hypothetical protein FVE85_7015 [Porphyridium purpureum]|uniref:Ornithine decarboxylase antizyme n=1 Tax=Porphyridium purpureum TaxID=35688 RepID=A0A5J4Z8K1_PORPP|nr:hypothetical protein FVE85_7015 [Porphyridium purpureum]|eukprot:POR8559..scf295_1